MYIIHTNTLGAREVREHVVDEFLLERAQGAEPVHLKEVGWIQFASYISDLVWVVYKYTMHYPST